MIMVSNSFGTITPSGTNLFELEENFFEDEWPFGCDSSNTIDFLQAQHSEHTKIYEQVYLATRKIYAEFPTSLPVDSPELEDAIAHRMRMWKTLHAHELEYWEKNRVLLQAIVDAFEHAAPLGDRQMKIETQPNDSLQIISDVRHALERQLTMSSLQNEREKLERIGKAFTFFERIHQIILDVKVTMPLELVKTTFEGANRVDVYGDSTNFVWKAKTFYCLAFPVVEKPTTLKTRTWVDWKFCHDEKIRGRVALFFRAKDWHPDKPKLCLKACDATQQEGWRTFQVFSVASNEVEGAKKPKASSEIPPEANAQEPSILQRLKVLEDKVDALQTERRVHAEF